MNPEARRSGGMHYTSIENIHKVIDPLFMDDLQNEFEEIKQIKQVDKRIAKAKEFHKKLGTLKFLDSACGSGNFLTETYLSLRRLGNECLKVELNIGQRELGLVYHAEELIQVSIHQFYGIEINDFATVVAKTVMWIAESQIRCFDNKKQKTIYINENQSIKASNINGYLTNADNVFITESKEQVSKMPIMYMGVMARAIEN